MAAASFSSSLSKTRTTTPRHVAQSLLNPPSLRSPRLILPLRFNWNASLSLLHSRLSPLKAASASSDGDNLLRKPLLSQRKGVLEEQQNGYSYEEEEEEDTTEEDLWVDWEDQILEDTVPLVAFVRTILHSGQYINGERLSPEHEKTILEKLLPFHPEYEKKIGCGIDYITSFAAKEAWALRNSSRVVSYLCQVNYHPNFDRSRCLFIVRQDGELVDFSYWKCIKGLIRKNYPLYADSFILRHFRKKSRNL